MRVPRKLLRKITNLKRRVRQSQSATFGYTTSHARGLQRKLAHATQLAHRIRQF